MVWIEPRDDSHANLVVSPSSLHATLAASARGGTLDEISSSSLHSTLATSARGGTLDEIASFLGPAGFSAHVALAYYVALRVFADDGEARSGTTIPSANGVWVDAGLQLKATFARVAAVLLGIVSPNGPGC